MDGRKAVAELVGTFLFLLVGYLSVVAFGAAEAPGLLVVPFSFGLGLLAAIFMVGHISGAHFNPAVTLAMALDRRTAPAEALAYVVAQIAGAVGAGLVVLGLYGQEAVRAGITAPGAGTADLAALVIEVLLTAAFLLVILTATKRSPSLAPLAIPLTLVAIHFAAAPLSGASVNPARSIGSALAGGDLGALWIYLVGPLGGGALGWALFRVLDGFAPDAG
ncbi:MAG TPA: aquaporin [Candidatus Limnocylindrales bacterium]|nr:aquaporin [Candidatus Limnocylindrales bacterium]